jgi:hypothetical protein
MATLTEGAAAGSGRFQRGGARFCATSADAGGIFKRQDTELFAPLARPVAIL